VPTYDKTARFKADFRLLDDKQRAAFLRAVDAFREDLSRGQGFRNGLRVKGVQGADGVFEMTWAANGRATFSYGQSLHEGEPHIIWRRIGTHGIFGTP
jgi:hypothetical protein